MGKLGQAGHGGAEHCQGERHRLDVEDDKLAAVNPRPSKEAGRRIGALAGHQHGIDRNGFRR